MTIAVLAEKPAVARDIAAVLGAKKRIDGGLIGPGYVVTWAIGHLVTIAEPDEMNDAWKRWSRQGLPMFPADWKLSVSPKTSDHFLEVQRILLAPEVDSIVCATDAGREGELIFRYIYQKCGCKKPVKRLWISSLTADAIRKGFASLRPSKDFDNLAHAAEARSKADWLVGMNLSRAYTLRLNEGVWSVGRVQTPTLAMIVDRDKAIDNFVPEPYCEVHATFGDETELRYDGLWFDPSRRADQSPPPERLPADKILANEIQTRCSGKHGQISSISGTDKSFPAPLLYDLTELQRHANRLYGITAKATLTAAQALYETHKLISYPRTDSRHLSQDIAATLPQIVEAIKAPYADKLAPGTGSAALSKRFIDDTKVTDHHAIIPTPQNPANKDLNRDESLIYDLICRRLLMAWHLDHRTRITTVLTRVAHPNNLLDWFRSKGTQITELGWKVLDIQLRRDKDKESDDDKMLPSELEKGLIYQVKEVKVLSKKTQPPKRFTDGTILSAMESAGKCLDDRELEEAMRERGLGTPATRAAILETLLERGYLERDGKTMRSTEKGVNLIDVVHPLVKSPAMTGEWEYALTRMERGEGQLPAFISQIEAYVRKVLDEVLDSKLPSAPVATPQSSPALTTTDQLPSAPLARPLPKSPASFDRVKAGAITATRTVVPPGTPLLRILKDRFGHQNFRVHQQDVCEAVAKGHDALLVMPTGSGKSLCYQLPGIARGGTTLVISPLIALMEDQTAKLQAMGLSAERVHSARTREQSREACKAYLRGDLDFLTISPERLAVPGFPEMLARRPPTLIAIDEAHCISHWGHDFRPEYRLLGERLPLLRPSPVLALTATATVRVQDDILTQLAIPTADRFIRGFRRDNLAVEVVDCSPAARLDKLVSTLASKERRPAIVYAPTRKQCESVAERLSRKFTCEAYHAGMDAAKRNAVQTAFINGKIDVVVATIAFGMGIDKADVRTVVHMALPGTLEGYYQEIGRAGRDGAPSRAMLFYSYADRHLHLSFIERDYPPVSTLSQIQSLVPPSGMIREQLIRESQIRPEIAEAAITKLWIHGGLTVDSNDTVFPTKAKWQKSYEAIGEHRSKQLDDIFDFAQSGGCRMLRLVRHFGETQDQKPCKICDNCDPTACEGRQFRKPSAEEHSRLAQLIGELRSRDGVASGTLYRNLYPSENLDRKIFEQDLDALGRSKVIELADDSFEKEGKIIRFRRVFLSEMSVGTIDQALSHVTFDGSAPKAGKKCAVGKAPRKAPAVRAPLSPRAAFVPRQATERATTTVHAPSKEIDSATFERLRTWRLVVSKSKGIPAFRILTDQTLKAIATFRPETLDSLAQIKGIGPKIIEKYGKDLLRVLRPL